MNYSSVRPLISEIARIIKIYFFFNNTAVGRVLMIEGRVSFDSEYFKGDFPTALLAFDKFLYEMIRPKSNLRRQSVVETCVNFDFGVDE